MAQATVDTWQIILESLREEIPAASFNTWFKHTTLERFSDEEAVIGVASLFIKERIVDHYQGLIQKIIREQFQVDPKISFRVSAEPLQQLRREQKQADTQLHKRPLPATAARKPSLVNRLNPEFILDNFFAGPSNQIALGACLRVIAAPAEFNPLTIQGGSGLGKTHLLQAVCHEITANSPEKNVLYLSTEAFANQFFKAVADKDRHTFQQRMRSTDVLILDDIQFLTRGSKEATQEELLHTFDALEQSGKQLILSCDRDPRKLEGLMPRLAKRFISGLTVTLENPTPETCRSIVFKKAALRRLTLSNDVAEMIATNTDPCGREIDGAVARLAAISGITGCAPNHEMVASFLELGQRVRTEDLPPPSVEEILNATAEVFSVSVSDLTGRRRQYRIKDARKAGMILARQLTDASLSEIGTVFGKRSHATVLQAVRGGEAFLASTETLRCRARELRGRFSGTGQQPLFDTQES